jgi:hypothetical protein
MFNVGATPKAELQEEKKRIYDCSSEQDSFDVFISEWKPRQII